jgi:hypothetical protein
MSAATRVYPAKHSLAGQVIEPLGYLKDGTAVWPMFGAAPDEDDPDDPTFTGGDDDEDDSDDEDDEDDTPSKKSKKSTKSKKDEDDDEDDDDEDEKPTRPERQAARYRTKLREQERLNADLTARLKAIEDKDKKPDEVVSRDLSEARDQVSKLTQKTREMTAQLAFFRSNTIEWVDPSDAFALAEREGLFEDVVDEDGNVDSRELRRGLRDLARRKKHLVKTQDDPKARGRKSSDDDEDDDEEEDDEPRSRRSASSMNSTRRGKRGSETTSRAKLAKDFPVLNRI